MSPFIEEVYSWVDSRLKELYYDYIVAENDSIGELPSWYTLDTESLSPDIEEEYSWVDSRLEELYYDYAVVDNDSIDELPMWYTLDSVSRRPRCEEDISDFETSVSRSVNNFNLTKNQPVLRLIHPELLESYDYTEDDVNTHDYFITINENMNL